MKIDVSKKIANLDGSVAEGAPSLSDVMLKALLEDLRGDEHQTGKDKFDRALLAQRIQQADKTAEITAEEIATIKDRIGRAFSPVVVFGAWNLLEGGA